MSNWAPMVHGRTYEVDFRSNLIVAPEWFTDSDIAWAREYARASTRSAEGLDTDGPRWLLFKNERYMVAGVACMAEAVSADMTHDKPTRPGETGRRLYVFLGWVTTDLTATPPPMDLAAFRDLYHFVRLRWHERAPGEDIHTAPGSELTFPPLPMGRPASLNTDPNRVFVWPDSERTSLWRLAAQHAGPVSLCLGLARSRDALDTQLLNITVAKSEELTAIVRPTASPTATPPSPEHARGTGPDPLPPPGRRRSMVGDLLECVLAPLRAVLRVILPGGDREPPIRRSPADRVDGVPAGFRKAAPRPTPTPEEPKA